MGCGWKCWPHRTHTHAHAHKERTAVGLTQDYLCLTCLSPTAARCSWPSRCFSLSFSLSLYSSLFHTRYNTHRYTPSLTHTHTHSFLHTSQPLSILSLKGIAFQARIKQMGLCKHCCSFAQHLGLSTDSPHALQAVLSPEKSMHTNTHVNTRHAHAQPSWNRRISPVVDGWFACVLCSSVV